MGFKRYEFQILVRLLLIVANCFAAVYVWQLSGYYISFYNLALLLVGQIYLLFWYLTRWQRDLALFANSVKHGDYNITYNLVDRDEAYSELYAMLNSISAYVRAVKAESVQQNHYFQYLVENAQVGLLAYDARGTVLLSNAEASGLLGNRILKRIEQVNEFNSELYQELTNLPLNQPKLIKPEGTALRLSARLSKIAIDGKPIFLLSLRPSSMKMNCSRGRI